MLKLTPFEAGWLVGILEGEGSFWVMNKKPHYRYPKISVVMCDYDTVAVVARMFGDRAVTPQASRSENRKPMFRANLMGQQALDLMEAVHPHMSIRRRAKIEEILVEFRPESAALSGPMAFATAYTGFVGEDPVCFVGVSGMVTGKGKREARFCRFVTKPEWQGAGIGMRFLEYLTERELRGEGFIGTPTTSIIHSAHPALAVTLRRNPKWRQISQALHGGAKEGVTGMGGHMRAVMGFRYYGEAGVIAANRKKERERER